MSAACIVLLLIVGFNSGVMGAMILLGNVAGAAAGLTFTVSCYVGIYEDEDDNDNDDEEELRKKVKRRRSVGIGVVGKRRRRRRR